MADPKIDILYSHEPRGFYRQGDQMMVKVEDLNTTEMKELVTDGVFVFVGMKPNLDGIDGGLETDDWGYLKVDHDMRTNLPDIYAAGDVTSKQIRQITTAVSDGTIASIVIARELQ